MSWEETSGSPEGYSKKEKDSTGSRGSEFGEMEGFKANTGT